MEHLRFPVGRHVPKTSYSADEIRGFVDTLEAFPGLMRQVCASATAEKLATPYRPGGWTLRQLVHHVADSHLNAYTRIKLALTEDIPTIKPYDQDAWSQTADSLEAPVEWSLSILDGLHARWVYLLRSLEPDDLDLRVRHPEFDEPMRIVDFLALYDWHCRHHLAHARL